MLASLAPGAPLDALRRFWGYAQFRPAQERIIAALLGGRDVCAILPTGGGKSLCYQLPAALLPGRTVLVVSPLIALMQDQVAQLARLGLPAAALNSSMEPARQMAAAREAEQGRYRLLYVSPERLARPGALAWLRRMRLALIAIDEAHCISEWGHEVRPDYRQLGRLREALPQPPIAAFTASATRRVRHDIVAHLQLRDPLCVVASFHRPNLAYRVRRCDPQSRPPRLLAALRRHAGESVIVYASTIAAVEETAAALRAAGVPALQYHGQMDTETRRRHQEQWTAGTTPVLVGTLAFGLGINHPSVRAVIHLALPKSLEQYYQEAGRAGRDGLPAECLLLWQPRDLGLLAYFAGQIQDAEEKRRAWQHRDDIAAFARSQRCRPWQICRHFGEAPQWSACGLCDICQPDRAAPASPRLRRGGASARPCPAIAGPAATGAALPEPALWEHLRQWRRAQARAAGLPAFCVFSDRTLNAVCAARPATLADLEKIPGIRGRKALRWGPAILQALAAFPTPPKSGEPFPDPAPPA